MPKSVSVNVSLNYRDLARFARTPKEVVKAQRMAGRDAIRTVRTEAGRHIRARKRLRVRDVNSNLRVRLPSAGELVWILDVADSRVPLVDYPYRQTRLGVSVAVNRGAERKLVKSAFVARMRSGHLGVFVRDTRKRLPISELYSTRVLDLFDDQGMIDATLERGAQVYATTFERVLTSGIASTQ